MGDRALVMFHKDKKEFSACIYLHWLGSTVFKLLEEAYPRLKHGDTQYSAARFCGVCHERCPGNTGLGILSSVKDLVEAKDPNTSHGDAGVFLVNVDTFEVECFNGYSKGTYKPVMEKDEIKYTKKQNHGEA